MGDVDRKKYDVDIVERVLGNAREPGGPDEQSTNLLNLEMPWHGGSTRSTVELTVGLPSELRSGAPSDDRGR